MNIGGFDFKHICDIEPARDVGGTLQIFLPQARYMNARNIPLNAYGHGPFCKFKIPSGYTSSGVYALTFGPEIQYIGRCNSLSPRFNAGYGNISPKNCFRGGQETNCRVNNLIYQATVRGTPVSLWFHKTSDHIAVEAALIAGITKIWNRI